jgi:hypothetical protein
VVAAQQQAEALQAQMELYSKLLAAQSAALKQIQGAFATPTGLLRARASRARAAQAASDGFAPQTVTQDEVFDFELGVANNGLPDPIREDLAQLGATDDQVDMIRQVVMVQDPEAVAGEYPVRMADQTLINDLSAAAASLRADLPPAIGHLIEAVTALNLPVGIPNGLLSKLTAAQQALDAHNVGGVCSQLGSFISQVAAQRGKKIRTADANALIDEARAVRQQLGCGGA